MKLKTKNLKSSKIQNQEKYFKMEKNVSESRNVLLQDSRKKSWIQWLRIQWTSQPTFTCLKSSIEILEKGVKNVQS